MATAPHDLALLFRQLGLPDEPASIDAFVAAHRALDPALELAHAPFWSPAQRAFLVAALIEDAEWCGPADLLNARLR